MKKRFSLLILMVCLCGFVSGQVSFFETFSPAQVTGLSIEAIKQTSDGGYIACGINSESSGYNYSLMIRMDSNGDTLWTRSYRPGLVSAAYDVIETNDGGFLMTGYSDTSSNWTSFAYLIKTDAGGNILWNKLYNAGTNGYKIVTMPGGGYALICGLLNGRTELIRTDANGNTIWSTKQKLVLGDMAVSTGFHTGDNGFVLTGYSFGIGGNDTNAFLLRLDSLGNTVWFKTYGSVHEEKGTDVLQTNDGGFLLLGDTYFDMSYIGTFLIRTDANGDTIWTHVYARQNANLELNSVGLIPCSDGNFVFGASTYVPATNIDLLLCKVDLSGNRIVHGLIGASSQDRASFLTETADGGFIASGFSTSFGNVNGDGWIVKTNSVFQAGCYDQQQGMSDRTQPWTVASYTPVDYANVFGIHSAGILQKNGINMLKSCFLNSVPEEQNDLFLVLYPNPASDYVNLLFESIPESASVLSVTDMQGKVLFTQPIASAQTDFQIHVSDLPDGVYFLIINSETKLYQRRLVIAH